jgi:hypothetical protein
MSLPPEDERTVLAFDHAAAPQPPDTGTGGAATTNALPTGTHLGEFEITGLLGEGGFGIVYLAYDNSLERLVALKEYMPSAFASRSAQSRVSVKSERYAETFQAGLRSFVNEARILAQFDHPSLIEVYRFWEANGTAYMVMPYYRGPTLKQALLASAVPPGEAWLKQLLAPLLDTLALIHEQQCFHRDIAPDNILMLDDGRPLLLDFGAARRAISGMTQAFTVIFKEGYAPIEQYAEMPGFHQGAWTDLYALASVVHFAIAGEPPPPAVGRIMADSYVPLADRFADRYSVPFLAAIDHALSVKPEDRPQSVAEMRALLDLAVVALPPAPAQPAHTLAGKPAVTPPARRLRPYLIAIPLLAAAGLGYALIGNKPAPAPAPPPAVVAAQFDPVASIQEIRDRASTARPVSVQPAQSTVQIGKDRLSFTVTVSHAGYLYVQMVGTESNNFWLMFPNTLDQNNRVEAGQTLTLPRKGWQMGVFGPPGVDHFVAILSDVPRDFTSAGLVRGDPFSTFPVARAAQLQRDHTGATPLFAGTPVCGGAADCSPLYGASTFTIEEINR